MNSSICNKNLKCTTNEKKKYVKINQCHISSFSTEFLIVTQIAAISYHNILFYS